LKGIEGGARLYEARRGPRKREDVDGEGRKEGRRGGAGYERDSTLRPPVETQGRTVGKRLKDVGP